MNEELHFLDNSLLWQNARNWFMGFLATFSLLCVYALVQVQDQAVEAREQVAAYKARGCPDSLDGMPFQFSAHEQVSLSRPGYSSLACFYGKGKS